MLPPAGARLQPLLGGVLPGGPGAAVQRHPSAQPGRPDRGHPEPRPAIRERGVVVGAHGLRAVAVELPRLRALRHRAQALALRGPVHDGQSERAGPGRALPRVLPALPQPAPGGGRAAEAAGGLPGQRGAGPPRGPRAGVGARGRAVLRGVLHGEVPAEVRHRLQRRGRAGRAGAAALPAQPGGGQPGPAAEPAAAAGQGAGPRPGGRGRAQPEPVPAGVREQAVPDGRAAVQAGRAHLAGDAAAHAAGPAGGRRAVRLRGGQAAAVDGRARLRRRARLAALQHPHLRGLRPVVRRHHDQRAAHVPAGQGADGGEDPLRPAQPGRQDAGG
mmetsp:Transcript_32989/g.56949  ORF Transcript_32989/g.56949 Transcript_32989/m.56949 type:complete len:330 (-) Transcript_32989:461-1450(-)